MPGGFHYRSLRQFSAILRGLYKGWPPKSKPLWLTIIKSYKSSPLWLDFLSISTIRDEYKNIISLYLNILFVTYFMTSSLAMFEAEIRV